MIRMSIENSMLRRQLRTKHGSGNKALMKAETPPPCSLLGVTLKKQGLKTQNAESDPESNQVTLSIAVCIQGVHKGNCYFSSRSQFS